jgi:acyl carrier protein
LPTDLIRKVLADHAKLVVDVDQLTDTTDLYSVGLTSHSSVSVLIGLETELDLEFPDNLLRKSTFTSISTIRDAIAEVRTG